MEKSWNCHGISLFFKVGTLNKKKNSNINRNEYLIQLLEYEYNFKFFFTFSKIGEMGDIENSRHIKILTSIVSIV